METTALASDGPGEEAGRSSRPDLRQKHSSQWVWPQFVGKRKEPGSNTTPPALAPGKPPSTAMPSQSSHKNEDLETSSADHLQASVQEPAKTSSPPAPSSDYNEEICPDDEHKAPVSTAAGAGTNQAASTSAEHEGHESTSEDQRRRFSIKPIETVSSETETKPQSAIRNSSRSTESLRKKRRVSFKNRDNRRASATIDQPDVEVRVFCAPDCEGPEAPEDQTMKRPSVSSTKTNDTKIPYKPASEQPEESTNECPCISDVEGEDATKGPDVSPKSSSRYLGKDKDHSSRPGSQGSSGHDITGATDICDDVSHINPGGSKKSKDVTVSVTIKEGGAAHAQINGNQSLTKPRIDVIPATESDNEPMTILGSSVPHGEAEPKAAEAEAEADSEPLLGPKLGSSPMSTLHRSKSIDCVDHVPLQFSKHLRRNKSTIGAWSAKAKKKMTAEERKRIELVEALKKKEEEKGRRPRTWNELFRGATPAECREEVQRLDKHLEHAKSKNMDPTWVDFLKQKRAAAKKRTRRRFIYKRRVAFYGRRLKAALLGHEGDGNTRGSLSAEKSCDDTFNVSGKSLCCLKVDSRPDWDILYITLLTSAASHSGARCLLSISTAKTRSSPRRWASPRQLIHRRSQHKERRLKHPRQSLPHRRETSTERQNAQSLRAANRGKAWLAFPLDGCGYGTLSS